jgi:drug/metabolite transporter (DMT)-like permease
MQQHRPLFGIALMVLSSAFLAVKDGLAKTFLDQVSPPQMIWTQYVGSFLVLALFAASRHGLKVLQPEPLGGQVIRGTLSAAAVGTLYWALKYVPLADATAVFMCAPLLVALLAPLVLNEHLDIMRMVAVGFAGVVVILMPGFGDNGIGYYIALLSGLLFGGSLLANRRLATAQAPLLNVTHNALMGGIGLTLLTPLYWQPPAWHNVPKLACIVGLAVVVQGLLITAFNYAPAAVLAPFTYTMLVFAALIGFSWFGTLPSVSTMFGMAMIFGAGLYIAERERAGTGAASPLRR